MRRASVWVSAAMAKLKDKVTNALNETRILIHCRSIRGRKA